MGASRTLDFFDGKLHSWAMSDDPKYPSQLAERFQVRLPEGLRDRIKAVAEKNSRSMNAEIVATLEEKYPPVAVDLRALAEFLESLQNTGSREADLFYLNEINGVLAGLKLPYTIEVSGDGIIKFFPFATHPDAKSENDPE